MQELTNKQKTRARWLRKKEQMRLLAVFRFGGRRAKARARFVPRLVGTWHFTKADAAKLRAERGA